MNEAYLKLKFGTLLLLAVILGVSGIPVTKTQSAIPRGQSQTPQFERVAPGVEFLQFTRPETSADNSGPWLISLLRVDLNLADIQFVRALDAGRGLETTSSLAQRYGALAAINGGYFRTTGVYRGESVGVYKLRGKLISETHNDRAAIGLIDEPGRTDVVLGHLGFSGELQAPKSRYRVNGLNRPRAKDELLVFTPEFHRTTLTTPDGIEVTVHKHRVTGIRDLQGSSQIPAEGYVISANGAAREWVLTNLKPGMRLTLSLQTIVIGDSQQERWRRVHSIVGGGPQLVRDGKVAITNAQEKILPAFVSDLHPRTALAKLASGKLLLVTVDGRQPGISIGMSLNTLADLLIEFEAVEGINLDGGGSTTMVVQNKVVNKPSDATGERPVSDAILVFAR